MFRVSLFSVKVAFFVSGLREGLVGRFGLVFFVIISMFVGTFVIVVIFWGRIFGYVVERVYLGIYMKL